MANLAIVLDKSLSKVVVNRAEAAFYVAATSAFVGCILLFHDNQEFSKAELCTEVIRAGYICWKWKMGLGPEPTVNTGLPDEVPRCKALEAGRPSDSQK